MKIVLQRVKQAKVIIDNKVNGEIETGYLLLLGVGKNDTEETAIQMIEKVKKLRLFEDENGKTNLSLEQVDGKFWLYHNSLCMPIAEREHAQVLQMLHHRIWQKVYTTSSFLNVRLSLAKYNMVNLVQI